ncbi:MAG: mechanosensitive ion channel family protein [Desulfuromonadales bacterium]|jgi:small-conductance mechanosensitive channel|nr:mechanosensitive ion channel family protein [Desulfuromonadales bacterium]
MKALTVFVIFFSYFVFLSFVRVSVRRIGKNKDVNIYRVKYVTKILNLVVSAFFVSILFVFLGIEYSQVSFFLSSVFAVIGVALFAQWSILSNITASLMIFFFFPYRVGDQVKVVDNDDDISGVIEEISLFHVIIKRENDLVTYPNSLILQKAVIKHPKANKDDASDLDLIHE